MLYENPCLMDFWPVLREILENRNLSMRNLKLEIIDEEDAAYSLFQPCDVLDVLEQMGDECNHLLIYTERASYFSEFCAKMYEENGLIVQICSKKCIGGCRHSKDDAKIRLLLDFEWQGLPKYELMNECSYYIPIHKRPWKIMENLDIAVPFGYNTLIVKSAKNARRRAVSDRFEEAFYRMD